VALPAAALPQSFQRRSCCCRYCCLQRRATRPLNPAAHFQAAKATATKAPTAAIPTLPSAAQKPKHEAARAAARRRRCAAARVAPRVAPADPATKPARTALQ